VTSWAYSALDIFAKYIFAFLLLQWVADNEQTVAAAGSTLGTTPGDD
jgi:halorhodopsin